MRPLRYIINTTIDGCVDHMAGVPDAELHQFHAQRIAEADALVLGRVTYQMMEEAWRPVAETGVRPDWMDEWMVPFAKTIHAVKKYVVSTTLEKVDWNAELITGDLTQAINDLKQQPGGRISTGGVKLPLALAELGLVDEVEFVVMPRLAGHGPTLLAGLSKPLELKLVERQEFASGSVVLRYDVVG